jgi:hypothetical protein
MEIEECLYCGEEMELDRCDYAKYGMSDCEEIVSIYECKTCNKWFTKREGNFELEED